MSRDETDPVFIREQCDYCVFYVQSEPVRVCQAFPAGIPPVILANNADHRQPIAGQVTDTVLTLRSDVSGDEKDYLFHVLDQIPTPVRPDPDKDIHTIAKVLGLKNPGILKGRPKQ